jgi:uncharacterized protein (DUF1697 family)
MPMKKYIALFRGMNVGGNRVPMKELAALLEGLGCQNVSTYIQSGNAVFMSPVDDATALSGAINASVRDRHGFDPAVLLLDPDEARKAVRNNPFPEAEGNPQFLHLGFLASAPEKADMPALESLRRESEQFRLIGKVFYLLAPEGVGRSRLAANAERALGTSMTDRNWRTVCAVLELADDNEICG